ncbi:MAG: 16S rRNA (uracil(1498)-N(3))-methyltransferase [Planctomycetota bacterium]
MNLLLLDPDEVGADGRATLTGRRAVHLRQVLRVEVGRSLQAGILDGPIGTAEVVALDGDAVQVRVDCRTPPPPARDVLLLAVPRPKVLLRVLEYAAALGFAELVLFRSWRVDKSWLDSSALRPDVVDLHLRLGLEQARRTARPRLQLFRRFRPFVEDVLPHLPLPAHRFCAHPTAAVPTHALAPGRGAPFAVALGPEGGFLPYEVARLADAGFLPVRLSGHPLRTEAALCALHAQLDLLRSPQ